MTAINIDQFRKLQLRKLLALSVIYDVQPKLLIQRFVLWFHTNHLYKYFKMICAYINLVKMSQCY